MNVVLLVVSLLTLTVSVACVSVACVSVACVSVVRVVCLCVSAPSAPSLSVQSCVALEGARLRLREALGPLAQLAAALVHSSSSLVSTPHTPHIPHTPHTPHARPVQSDPLFSDAGLSCVLFVSSLSVSLSLFVLRSTPSPAHGDRHPPPPGPPPPPPRPSRHHLLCRTDSPLSVSCSCRCPPSRIWWRLARQMQARLTAGRGGQHQ